MNTTLSSSPSFGTRAFQVRSFGASFQGFCRWLVDGTPIGLKPMQQTSLRQNRYVAPAQGLKILPSASWPAAMQPAMSQQVTVRPVAAHPVGECQRTAHAVRVVRVQESGQPLTSVGRMVISGRMADVCAELDRLAAQDATLH